MTGDNPGRFRESLGDSYRGCGGCRGTDWELALPVSEPLHEAVLLNAWILCQCLLFGFKLGQYRRSTHVDTENGQ